MARVYRTLTILVFVLTSFNLAYTQGDIALSKSTPTATAVIGDQITFTIDVTNEGTTNLTGIEVTDALPANTTFVSSGGAGSYNSGTGVWTIASIAAGITESFTITVEITGEGIIYNLAEITALDQTDDDSTPANGDYNEDDISSACVSVPVKICSTIMDTIEASVPVSGLTNIQWFRDTGSGPVAFGSGSPIDIVAEGEYTFTADNAVGCEAGNCCPLIVEEYCFDLAMTKVAQAGVTNPGDDKTFTFTIYNQGNVDAYNIVVTDYLPTGLTFDDTYPTNLANSWTLIGGLPTSTIVGPLPAGTNTNLSLVLMVDSTFQGTSLINNAEVSSADDDSDTMNTPPTDIDSTPDLIEGNDAGGLHNTASDDEVNGDGTGTPGDAVAATDEDDEDPAFFNVTQTYDLALEKTITSTGPYVAGDNVTFQIKVKNEGSLNAAGIIVEDHIPTGMTFVSSPDFSATAPHITSALIVPGYDSLELEIVLKINDTYTGTFLTNEAEITADDGTDIDSTVDDGMGDDYDTANVTVEHFYDLALTKEIIGGPYAPGDDVTFRLTLYNQGTSQAYNTVITDYIPTDMNFDAANTVNIANGWSLVGVNPTTTVVGPIAPFTNTTIDLVLEIDANFMSTLMVNKAEISGGDDDLDAGNTPPTDIDSTPDLIITNDAGGFAGSTSDNVIDGDGTGTPNDTVAATDEDDADPALVTVTQTYDLSLAKSVTTTGPYNLGDNISYSIVVSNDGTLDAANIEIEDLIPAGMTFVSGPSFSAVAPHNATISSLMAGTDTTLTITLQVDPLFSGSSLTNSAEVTIDDGDDFDSFVNDGMGDDFDTAVINIAPTCSVSGTQTTCGNNNGTATVSVTNGTAPFQYLWSDPSGQTTVTASSLAPGMYTVTVTDDNTLQTTCTVTITAIGTPTCTAAETTSATCGMDNGVATVTPVGGVAPYTYLWSDASGQTTAIASGLAAGMYTVTVTDDNTCETTCTVTITAIGTPTCTAAETTSATCGMDNGVATVTPVGGVAPYTYLWSDASGQTTAIASGLAAGMYTVTVTDDNTCETTCTVTITAIGTPTCTAAETTSATCGMDNGVATVTPVGGVAPYTYLWSDASGQTTAIASGLAAGMYTVTVTDDNTCETTCTVTITAIGTPTCTAAETTSATCGMDNGVATVTPVGGVAPYTYLWSDASGQTTAIASGLAAGMYTVTVTDDNTCETTCTVTITAIGTPTCTAAETTSATCGMDNGVATVTPVGGVAPYTYLWSDASGQTTAIASGLAAGMYTVTVTDDNTCETTCTVTITAIGTPTCTAAETTSATCGMDNGVATVTPVGGVAPYTYLWSDASGQTTAIASGLAAGMYTVTVTDDNTCETTCTVTITAIGTPTCTAAETTSATCGMDNGVATVTPVGGVAPYTYLWSDASGQTTAIASGLAAGMYTVTVTDDNTCETTCTVTITAIGTPTCTAAETTSATCGMDNGVATVTPVGGVAPYTYLWSDASGQTTAIASGLAAGMYTVTVTDDNTCETTCTVTITAIGTPTCTAAETTSATCGMDNGVATVTPVGGVAPYTYLWSDASGQTTAIASGLAAGMYTVTVTDDNTCETTCTVTITAIGTPTCTAAETTSATCGMDNGVATVTPVGGVAPYTYLWSDASGQTTAIASGLAAGMYTVTVTDDNTCETTCTVTITAIGTPTCTAAETTSATCGMDNGVATVTPVGGVAPYTYLWSDASGQTTAIASGLAAGMYTVTVTDDNTCETTCTVTITAIGTPTCTAAETTSATCGMDNGVATVTPVGGVAPYTYLWSDASGQTTAIASGLAAGMYTVTVTDDNTCETTCTVTITAIGTPTCTAAETTSATCGMDNGVATVTPVGGVAPYTYLWSDASGQTTAIASGLAAGMYTVTVTDDNTCETTCTVTITAIGTPTCTAAETTSATCGMDNGVATVTPVGGVAPYTYLWSDASGQTTAIASGLAAGMYTVTVTDDNTCETTCTVTITAIGTPTCTAAETTSATCGMDNGVATVTPVGGVAPYTYLWSDASGQTTAIASGLAAGMYTVTVTDDNTCETTCTVTINAIGTPTCTAAETTSATCGMDNGVATVTPVGGVAPYTYLWSDASGQTTAIASGLAAGMYTVTVTDDNTCETTCTVTITAIGTPTCTAAETTSVTCGMDNGVATVTPVGGVAPYTYLWSDASGQTTAIASGLAAGMYTVTVTDDNTCETTCTVTITAIGTPTCTAAETTSATCGIDNGVATVTPVGGVAPYTYLWSDALGQTTAIASGLAAGMYTVTVTDDNTCETTCTVTINAIGTPTCTAAETTSVTCGMDNGVATVTPVGGVAPYTYLWSDASGQTTAIASGLAAGMYTVTVTDDNTCETTCTVTITAIGTPTCTAAETTSATCGIDNGVATVTPVGGVAPYTYLWSDALGQTTAIASGLAAGMYTVTVTDDNTCETTCTVTITAIGTPTCTAAETTSATCGMDNGVATVTPVGGVAPYTYLWSDASGQTTAIASGLAAGMYTVTVTDDNTCETTCTVTINEIGCFYDLALSKVLLPGGPYSPGDQVTYEITVSNEGTLNATNVVVTDFLPAGLSFVSGTGFSATAPHTSTIANLPANGVDEVLTIVAQIDANFQGTSLTNVAEITLDDGNDVDSTPNNNAGEDDQGEATVNIGQTFDVAMTKVTAPGVYAPGDDVTFDFVIYNQGTLDAYEVELTDYIPLDMNFDGSNAINMSNGWSMVNGNLTTVISGPIAPGTNVNVQLVLQINSTFESTLMVNKAEISGFDDDLDPNNAPPVDVDSTPDVIITNDAGGFADTPSDNVVNGDGTGVPNDTDPTTDEDDADPSLVTVVQTYDLALSKVLDMVGPYDAGDNVSFTITVSNEGTVTANNISVVDLIPSGMNFVSSSNFSTTTPHLATIGSLAPGTSIDLEIVLQIDPTFTGTTLINQSEVVVDDGNDTDSFVGDGMGDDYDTAQIDINQSYDLSLTKNVVSAGPYAAGSVVDYEIVITNQGSQPATNIEVVDLIPTGMSFFSSSSFDPVAPHTATIANINPMQTETLSISLQIDPSFMGTSLDNEAEITLDDGNDVDSTPNDGMGDDYDTASISVGQIYDLEIDKQVLGAGPFDQGDNVTYEIEVFNVGTLDANNVSVVDILPIGMNFVSSPNFSVLAPHTATIVSLPSGTSQTLTITLEIDSNFQGTSLVNATEITSDDGNDVDSTPADGMGDDYDTAPISVNQNFDLALTKEVVGSGFNAGDEIVFDLVVYNQGTLDAYNVELTDFIPASMLFDPANAINVSENWSLVGGNPTTTILGPIALNSTATVQLVLQVDPSFMGTSLINVAEISSADDDMDNTNANPVDSDSNFDTNPSNDAGGLVNSMADNQVNGDGTGTPGSGDGVTDEDDSDPALVIIGQVFDLALVKNVTTPGPYNAGDEITYSIEVFNQGSVDAFNVDISDYISSNLIFDGLNVINSANGWTASGSVIGTTLPGPISANGGSESVDIVLQIDPSYTSGLIDNFAEISSADDDTDDTNTPPVDNDSTFDSDDSNDAGGSPNTPADNYINGDGTGIPGDGVDTTDEDDHDGAHIEVEPIFDLALTKILTPAQGALLPGELVTFTIEVFNQGEAAANNIQISDYVPLGLTLEDPNWNLNGGVATTTLNLPMDLSPNTSISTTITFRIDANLIGGTSIENNAEISSATNSAGVVVEDVDSAMDNDPNNDVFVGDNDLTSAGGDEDDHDREIIVVEVFDLALRKTKVSTEYLTPGGDIIFEITVFNQGNIAASNVEVFDYIPTGFTLSPNDTNGWFLSGSNGYNTITGPIAPNTSESIEIVLRAGTNLTAGAFFNRAEIIGSEDVNGNDMTDLDFDSTADSDDSNDNEINDIITDDGAFDEDDADVEPFEVQVFDLALQKVIQGASQITVGDDIDFTINVFNQGDIDASNIEVTDYIPTGFVLSNSNTVAWTMSGPNANTTILSLAAGQQISLDITLTATTAMPGAFANTAEISSAQDDMGVFITDVDSTPDGDSSNDNFVNDEINDNGVNDEDDHDNEAFSVVGIQLVDLALQKTGSGSTLVTVGDDVNFNIEVFNQGTVPAHNIALIDYLPAGLTLSINDTNGWVENSGNIENVIVGPLAPGTSESLGVVLTVAPGTPAGSITNIAEIYEVEDGLGNSIADQDVDSSPDTNPGNDLIQDDQIFDNGTLDEDDHDIAGLEIEIVDIALIKRISAAQSQPIQIGDDVLFEIELYNQGSVDLSNIQVSDYLPQGMLLSSSDTNGWGNIASSMIGNTYTGLITAGNSVIIDLLVTIDSSIDPNGADNVAEVSSFTDAAGISRSGDDIDSTPDSNALNDGPVTDDEIFNANGDEDDSDIATVIIGSCENVTTNPNETICIGGSTTLQATHSEPGVIYSWAPTVGLSCTNCANPIASPNTSVNYQVTATFGNCTTTANVTVTVVPDLTIDETIVDLTCCTGGSISLSVSGGSGSYIATWSDNSLSGLAVSNLQAGTYEVTVSDGTNCSAIESYQILDNCNCSDIVAQDTITIPATSTSEVCLPFTYQESQSIYEVILNGTGVVQPIDGCDIDSIVAYTYVQLVGQGNSGPYMLDNWTCGNGQIYGGVIFQDINELVDSMMVWDPEGSWSNSPATFTINGVAENTTYGDIEITHIGTQVTAFINPNFTGIANGQVYDVPDAVGTYQYTINKTVECCSETFVVIVEEPAAITPDYTSYFTEVNTPLFLCVNTSELATTPISLSYCEEPENGQVIFDTGNECMTYIPDPAYVGLDSFCVVVCDESGICDTTYVNVTISEDPHNLLDTIYYTTPQNTSTGFQCMPWQKFFSTGFDTLIVCGEPMNGTLISDGDNECIEYIPDTDFCGQDSMCIITCSDLNVCGTITIYIDVACDIPMPNPDTVYVSVTVNTILEDACVPLNELNGTFDTLFLCGDASNGDVATNDFDHCVDYTPDLNYLGPDEFCVVVCDSMMICDTTYFIIDVVGDPCDTTNVEFVSLETEDCDDSAVLCLPFDIVDVSQYTVTLGGDQYTSNFVGCDFDTTFSYNYFTIPGQGDSGPYVLDQWIVDGQAFSGNFVDVNDLVNLMNSFDNTSTWTLDAMNFRIRGGNPNTDYGDMFITQPSSGGIAVLQFNENLVANKAGLLLPVGMHDVRLTHTSGCPIYQYNVTVGCTPVMIDTIPYTFEVGDTLIVCPEELGIMDPVTAVFNNCPTSSGSEASVEIDLSTGCIVMIGLDIGDNEQACIEVCTADSCSQFVFLLEVLPSCNEFFSQDSMLIITNDCNVLQDVCLELPFADIGDYSINVNGSEYTGAISACTDGTAINLIPGYYNVIVTDNTINCIDSIEVVIACITPDTIYDSVIPMETDSICIELNELVGVPTSIENFCEGTSGEFVLFDITSNTYCVNYTGVEVGIDTACIVVCDDQNICDTTYLIVEVIEQVGTPPVANIDIDTTLLNTGTNINISVNDSIPGGIDTLYVLDNPGNGMVTINPDMTLTYVPDNDYCDSNTPDEFTYVICNEFGCDSAIVQVYVLCEEIIFFTGFSPNGDGLNDEFRIEGIENFPNHELAIYNRWGNQVLFSKDYKNEWSGTWENLPLPDGTYYYVFDDGNGNVYSGYIQIHR